MQIPLFNKHFLPFPKLKPLCLCYYDLSSQLGSIQVNNMTSYLGDTKPLLNTNTINKDVRMHKYLYFDKG